MEPDRRELTRHQRLIFWMRLNPMVVIALLLGFGIAIVDPTPPPTHAIRLDRVATVEGTLSGAVEPLSDGTLFFEIAPVRIEQQNQELLVLKGRIAVYVPITGTPSPDRPTLKPGDAVRFTAFLREPSYYLLPGIPDFRAVARRQGVPYRAYLKSLDQLERLPSLDRKDPIILIQRSFASFEEFCRERFSPPSAGLILGVFSGRKKGLLNERREDVEKLGIFHLLVVSGFHISVLVVFLHCTLGRWRRFSRLATLFLIWAYIAGIGAPVAAVRAGIMNSLLYLSLTLGVGSSFLNSVGLSAVCLMIWSPSVVFTPGFQFSYLCLLTIGIAVLPPSKRLHQALAGVADAYTAEHHLRYLKGTEIRRRFRYLVESLSPDRPHFWHPRLVSHGSRGLVYCGDLALCSLAIPVTIAPLTAYYSNVVVWTQSLSNMIMVPLFSGLIVLTFLYFLTFTMFLESLLYPVLDALTRLTFHLIDQFQEAAFLNFLPHPTILEIIIYVTLVGLGWTALSGAQRALLVLFPAFLLMFGVIPRWPSGVLEITMLDVGQGESIHLRYPDGSHALFDTGGLALPDDHNFMARRVVGRYLWSERAGRLAYLLITHPHMDHQQAYPFLSKIFRPSTLYYAMDHPDYQAPKWKIGKGFQFSLSGVNHTVLHPDLTQFDSFGSNDASLVVQLDYRDFQILFTGDIESRVEQILQEEIPRVDVLKVAHHGSRSSTTAPLVRQLSPRVALISSGRRNRFGHPSKEVVERLRRGGTVVYNTADLGSVRLVTDGHRLEVLHYDEHLNGFCRMLTTKLIEPAENHEP